MALTPTISNPLGGTLVVSNVVSPELEQSLAGALTVVNFPTPFIYDADAGLIIATNFLAQNIQVSDAGVMVVAAGRSADPAVRAWTFSLDGHDFYVLRLGEEETLVYDTHSGQWSKWSAPRDLPWWPADGINWLGATSFAHMMGSNVVVGDDTFGLLYFLDPRQGYDETPVTAQPDYYRRAVTGQVVHRRSSAIPCYEIFLTANLGNPALTGQEVELFVSDDAGHNYLSVGAITIEQGDYEQRVSWIGLGQITAPGRLFLLEDYGAVERVDALDMTNSMEAA